LDRYNQTMQRIQFNVVMNSGAASSSGDRVNTVAFSNTVFGQSFGRGTLAVTYYIMQGSNLLEADVIFNRAQVFDSYRGALRFGSNGFAVADIRRVFLHELGHGIGLSHPDDAGQNVDAIMNSVTGDLEVFSSDDTAALHALYGAPEATPAPAPTPGAPISHLANISTRMKVGVNDDVLIGGFIINGSQPKRMILRATGPSLLAGGLSGAMANPALELYDSTGTMIAANDDWISGSQVAEISASGVVPARPEESALLVTLPPGSYTAIVSGRDNTQGIALIEGYELDSTTTRLANLSTRGRIGVGDEVLIGGLIVQGTASKKVIVRALGPSLAAVLPGALTDPTMELYDAAGNQLAANDNWTSSPQTAEIVASGVPPSSQYESAVVATLAPGSYTAIVRGVNDRTGIGLVEVFDLDQ
jgi:hypothetical protein